MRWWQWVAASLAGGLILMVLSAQDDWFHAQATEHALERAGYGDMVVKRSRHFYCPTGQAMFIFIAQGRRRRETQGYVCTGYFGEASIHETKLPDDEDIDWD